MAMAPCSQLSLVSFNPDHQKKGNRNFEGRIHPLTRANYLASPPLCVAFALAGSITKDFEKEPIGISDTGKEVFLKDIWPSQEEIQEIISSVIKPSFFKDVYKNIQSGSESWQNLKVNKSTLYEWDPKSTYVRLPPYFDGMVCFFFFLFFPLFVYLLFGYLGSLFLLLILKLDLGYPSLHQHHRCPRLVECWRLCHH